MKSRVLFLFVLTLLAGCAKKKAASSSIDASADRIITLGALDKSVIQAAVQKKIGKLKFCYMDALSSAPQLAGRVDFKFIINEDGSLKSVKVEKSELKAPTAEACMLAHLQKTTFPQPKGGIVVVRYPIIFQME